MILFCICLLFCVACTTPVTSNQSPPESGENMKNTLQKNKQTTFDTAYKPSLIDATFPVPRLASKNKKKSKNPHMPYLRYDYIDLDNPEKNRAYFTYLKEVGWEEQTNEQMGRMHVFLKASKRIHMTIHNDYFTIFIPQSQINDQKNTSKHP